MTPSQAPPEAVRDAPGELPPHADLAASWLRASWHAVTCASLLAAPLALAWDLARRRGARPLIERLGGVPRSSSAPVWIQASSAGETSVALHLAAALRSADPTLPLALSAMTATGRDAAARGAELLAVPPFHLPVDAAPCVALALDRLRPRALVTIETDLWPVLFRACSRRGMPIAVVNGRLSQRHFPRYRRVRPLVRSVLADVALLAMRTGEDAERALALGAPPERVVVTGNVKFDAALGIDSRPDLPWAAGAGLSAGRWLVLASTAEGEEAPLLAAFAELARDFPDLRCVLAPKRLERRAAGVAEARRLGLPVSLRSVGDPKPVSPGGVLLLDTMGELARLYRHASLVFVGGSLVPHGGQNLLEPAAAGRPVLFGPHVENFRDAEEALLASGGGRRVSAGGLVDVGRDLLGDAARLEAMGRAARDAVRANEGATARTVALLLRLVSGAKTP